MSSPLLLLQPAQTPMKLPESPTFWMPLDASVTAADIDWLYMFMIWMSVICSLGIFAAMLYFVMKFRAGPRSANEVSEPSSEHNTSLEIGWSVIPLLICIALFVWGFQGFVNLRTPPKGALEVHVTGQKWKWLFEYPHGTEDVLHVPVDRDVRLILQSADVLHSFFIPNFRVKMDAVPGRFTDMWFRATQTGDFPVFCAEYCGTAHSDMLTHVKVHPPGGYEKWLADTKKKLDDIPLLDLGKLTVEKQGCFTCHTTDGTPKIGPTWKGVFGKPERLSGGASVTVNEEYIRESITDPAAKIVDGYQPSMPTYKGKLTDRQLSGIVEYIKSLK